VKANGKVKAEENGKAEVKANGKVNEAEPEAVRVPERSTRAEAAQGSGTGSNEEKKKEKK